MLLALTLCFSASLFCQPVAPGDSTTHENFLKLSQEEQDYLNTLGPVAMGVDPDWEPYEWIDAAGNHTGIAADLVRLIASRSGVTLQLVRTGDWEETIAASRSGKCRIISFLNQTKKRDEWLVFTEPYFSDPNVFITREEHDFIANPASLTGETVVFPAGTSLEERIRSEYPNLTVLIAGSETECLELVSSRKADMTVRSLTMSAYTIKKYGLFNLKVAGQLPGYENVFRIGVARDSVRLRDILNRGVATITPGEVQEIINRHISISVQTVIDYGLMLKIGLLLSVFASIGFLWTWQTKKLNRKLAAREKELLLSEQMLHSVTEQFPGYIFWKDRQSKFLGCNRAFAESVAVVRPDELPGKTGFDIPALEGTADKSRVEEDDVLVSGKASMHKPEKRVLSDGRTLWLDTCLIPLHDGQGQVFGVLGVLTDITERRASDEKILQLLQQLEAEKNYALKSALTDGLTGLANRRSFDESLNTEFYRLKRTHAPLSVVMMDIDHFKKYNDLYGHVSGDECLRKVALAVQATVGRLPDIAARYGGEEFVLILPETDGTGALTLAERVREAVEHLAIPHAGSDTADVVTISLGVVTVYPSAISTPEQTVEFADQALYAAKTTGRNKVMVSAAGIGESAGFIPLVWHTSDESGNSEIDVQHRQLFADANDLLTAVSSSADEQECRSLLRKLVEAIFAHFKTEEAILLSSGFPGTDTHRECHADLARRASALIAKYESGEMTFDDLFRFVTYDVLAQHMFVEDKKYFPYV